MDDELQQWKDATWAFLMEHCDIESDGALFFKFHATDRRNFENRVLSRQKYDYHREDYKAKELFALDRRAAAETRKRMKRERWKAEKERRRQLRKNYG